MLIMDTKDQKQGRRTKPEREEYSISVRVMLAYATVANSQSPVTFTWKFILLTIKSTAKNKGSPGNPLQMMIQRANMLLSFDPSIPNTWLQGSLSWGKREPRSQGDFTISSWKGSMWFCNPLARKSLRALPNLGGSSKSRRAHAY